MPHDLSALHRPPVIRANPDPSPLALAQRLGWPRLPDLGEIHEALAEIERSVRLARQGLREAIDLGESDRAALRRLWLDLRPLAAAAPVAIALLRAMQ